MEWTGQVGGISRLVKVSRKGLWIDLIHRVRMTVTDLHIFVARQVNRERTPDFKPALSNLVTG